MSQNEATIVLSRTSPDDIGVREITSRSTARRPACCVPGDVITRACRPAITW
jgi:hypothetical protein